MFYIGEPNDSINRLIGRFGEVTGGTQKLIAFVCINSSIAEEEHEQTVPFITAILKKTPISTLG